MHGICFPCAFFYGATSAEIGVSVLLYNVYKRTTESDPVCARRSIYGSASLIV